jgi:Ca2+-binding EF-hand superfamily protein
MIMAFPALNESNAADELFESIDKNSDDKVSLREFRKDMKENAFEKVDTDHDKVIEEKEWNSLENISDRQRHAELFERMDKDKDRRISFFEFSDYADRKSNIDEAFMGLDKDGSNNLSPDEMSVRPHFKMITIKLK